jgi:hypothetical protein
MSAPEPWVPIPPPSSTAVLPRISQRSTTIRRFELPPSPTPLLVSLAALPTIRQSRRVLTSALARRHAVAHFESLARSRALRREAQDERP